jgi:hypothetical protein
MPGDSDPVALVLASRLSLSDDPERAGARPARSWMSYGDVVDSVKVNVLL